MSDFPPTERDLLFGTDLQVKELAPGFDVVAGAGGDLAKTSGPDNIIQTLKLRLLVRRGELAPLGWPNFGSRLHELIGEPNNTRTRTLLMAHARAAVAQDPRVAEIMRAEARVLPGDRDVVRLDLELRLIAENTPLNLVLDVRLGTL